MGLYLGSSGELKVNLNGEAYYLNLYSAIPIINGIKLLSSDDYVLRDMYGLYITAKEEE